MLDRNLFNEPNFLEDDWPQYVYQESADYEDGTPTIQLLHKSELLTTRHLLVIAGILLIVLSLDLSFMLILTLSL